MEDKSPANRPTTSSLVIPTLPRDSRGSLEVFNPTSFATRPHHEPKNPSSPFATWQPRSDPVTQPQPPQPPSAEVDDDVIRPWLALPSGPTAAPPHQHDSETISVARKTSSSSVAVSQNAGEAAQRAAEWGLVLKTDEETGRPQGVTVRKSGDEAGGKGGQHRVSGGGSYRSSEDSDASVLAYGGSKERGGIPRVSEELRDALSAFQQTFVVSDATKPDHPIMYASAGFFNMTGYLAKEVIGRNCRFLQGSGTDPSEIEKIRETLSAGTNYCGRILNYKKDGTPFWNLLTIAPIKDDEGNTLKFIGMQVEVSKYTEGSKDTMVRPNGLPESLIRYDARQKDRARSSLSDLVMAVKDPTRLSESRNYTHMRKSEGGGQPVASEVPARRKSENTTSVRRNSRGETRFSMQKISELPDPTKKSRKSGLKSFMGLIGLGHGNSEKHEHAVAIMEEELLMESDDERPESFDNVERKKEMRRGIDLATTLERIEKNFVITDPRLPDNPIIFASDSFLELTEYCREEILGRNCRFLQGPETDPATVRQIRDAIDNQRDVTVQLINYTKTGKKFWNLFHLQPMRDQKGEVQYFIGVQLDGSEHVEPLQNCIPEDAAKEGEKLVKETAYNVDEAVKELPDANLKPEDLWANHSKVVLPKPHMGSNSSWKAIQKVLGSGENIGLKHFSPVKPLGSGDTGSVHLVELVGTGEYYAMKAMDKNVMLNRNKVHRASAEREILDMLDHPFLPTLYTSFQTKTHICLITDYCPGGELFLLLDRQPEKVLKEDAVRFYAAEVVVALEYLHCQGIIYRDLKPENILLQRDGHISLTDFDLSCLTPCKPQLFLPKAEDKKKQTRGAPPIFVAEPMRASNSFVGTEEYIAPEIITGAGHTSAVDWWALGILLYEMLYGYTPFRGKSRQKTFANVLHKDLRFPGSISASLPAKQLIYRLLHRDPRNRLGSCHGANDVKQHPFFRGINWALVRCMNPPKLVVPLFDTKTAEDAKMADPELDNLQTVF
ncbi:phototropin-1A-like [Zingiber officinale]|uniref:phototropin-1A-like n=1 Tax=Zingiber officinale TaxID=94328 RepID=UPI001C4B3EAB|nr:phototropin-1A-like [Zingiber officinale]XP_042398234.1 phototropin-1A-like [Zingiber officinale]